MNPANAAGPQHASARSRAAAISSGVSTWLTFTSTTPMPRRMRGSTSLQGFQIGRGPVRHLQHQVIDVQAVQKLVSARHSPF